MTHRSCITGPVYLFGYYLKEQINRFHGGGVQLCFWIYQFHVGGQRDNLAVNRVHNDEHTAHRYKQQSINMIEDYYDSNTCTTSIFWNLPFQRHIG